MLCTHLDLHHYHIKHTEMIVCQIVSNSAWNIFRSSTVIMDCKVVGPLFSAVTVCVKAYMVQTAVSTTHTQVRTNQNTTGLRCSEDCAVSCGAFCCAKTENQNGLIFQSI